MKQNFTLLMLVFWVAMASAQKYHDAAAFDLRGNVKEAKLQYSNSSNEAIYRFTSEGALSYHRGEDIDNNCILKRESDGYLSHLNLKSSEYEYVYDDSHRIILENYKIAGGLIGPFEGLWIFDYNDKGYISLLTSDIFRSSGDSYNYTKFDNKGNWTERNVIDLKTNTLKYIEKRSITYWENVSVSNNVLSEQKHINIHFSYKLPYSLKKAKDVDIKQLILHPFGIKSLTPKSSSNELLKGCSKMKWNAMMSTVLFNGLKWGEIKFMEVTPGDFRNVFGYTFEGCTIIPLAGFNPSLGVVFEWSYTIMPNVKTEQELDKLFDKVLQALKNSGLKMKHIHKEWTSPDYLKFEFDESDLSDITISKKSDCVKISICPIV